MKGVVKWYKEDKGYGFIQGEEGDVFVHISQVNGDTLEKGQQVEFDTQIANKGLQAANVKIITYSE